MKRTILLPTIIAVAAITSLPPHASAYYHAQLGRFLNRDPIAYDAGDENLYRYVWNTPTNDADPSGMAGERGGRLSGEEAAALKGCKPDTDAQDVVGDVMPLVAGVMCVGGRPEPFHPNPKLVKDYWEGLGLRDGVPEHIRDWITDMGLRYKCGFMKCTWEHELHHVSQFNALDPGVCCPEMPELLEGQILGWETTRCQQRAEFFAYQESLACLKNMRRRKLSRDCREFLDREIESEERSLRKAKKEGGL